MYIEKNTTIGLISLSNGLSEGQSEKVTALKALLIKNNYKVIESNALYSKNYPFSATAKEKAEELHKLYLNKDVTAIFDLSGGDLCNEALPYIDFSIIKNNNKPYIGYSDLSVIINSIYSQTGNKSILYRPFNLLEANELQSTNLKHTNLEEGNLKSINLKSTIFSSTSLEANNTKNEVLNITNSFISIKESLLDFNYEFLQGSSFSGVVVGGNLRCTLKLAGTKYLPDFNDKILLLESLGGDVPKIVTYLNQYKQIGAFNNLRGIILGTFTEMEKNNLSPTVYEILLDIIDNKSLPIIKTKDIGHSPLSKAIIIGETYSF